MDKAFHAIVSLTRGQLLSFSQPTACSRPNSAVTIRSKVTEGSAGVPPGQGRSSVGWCNVGVSNVGGAAWVEQGGVVQGGVVQGGVVQGGVVQGGVVQGGVVQLGVVQLGVEQRFSAASRCTIEIGL